MREKEIHSLIRRIFRQGEKVLVGPGDDCAALDVGTGKLMLFAADQVVSDVHYLKDRTPSSAVAVKLLNRNLSDIAAMGGEPSFALLTIAAKSAGEKWITGFLMALQKEASKWRISICGGDVSSARKDVSVCTLTIAGWVEKDRICLRAGAKPGDLLYATGCFGNSFRSGHHLEFVPRIEAGRFLAGRFTRCMIDVSDGLISDAQRICEASGVSLVIDTDSIPLRKGADIGMALAEGEDYELIFSVNPAKSAKLEKAWPFKKIRLTCIGKFISDRKKGIYDGSGKPLASHHKTGYEHFVP